MQQIELNYTTTDLKNMIIFRRLLTDQSLQKTVISLTMFLIKLPHPFVNTAKDCRTFFANKGLANVLVLVLQLFMLQKSSFTSERFLAYFTI